MSLMSIQKKIIGKMYENDAFSQWLGIEIIEAETGNCKLKMAVRDEMCNGFGIIHGGITFSLADSALAFAANAHGRLSVALECSISYPKSVNIGDVLFAEATELSLSNKIGIYNIHVSNQNGELVGVFKGSVYRTSKEWEV
jgi:acyl-CoA thioesterase